MTHSQTADWTIKDRINEMRWYGKNLSCGGEREDGKSWREAYNEELDALIAALRSDSAPTRDNVLEEVEHAVDAWLHITKDAWLLQYGYDKPLSVLDIIRALKNAAPQAQSSVGMAIPSQERPPKPTPANGISESGTCRESARASSEAGKERDAKDAWRYRWVRGYFASPEGNKLIATMGMRDVADGSLDSAIDAHFKNHPMNTGEFDKRSSATEGTGK